MVLQSAKLRGFTVRMMLLTLSLLVALVEPLFAKPSARPDISGTWILNIDKSKLAKGTDIHSETLVIACSESTITIRDDVDGKLSTRTYLADGKDHPFAEVRGGQDFVRASWKKSTFVIEVSGRLKTPNSSLDGSEVWHTEDRWSVSADGRVLTEKSEAFDTTTTLVYDKQ